MTELDVVLMVNNWGGQKVTEILKDDDEANLSGLVLNQESKQKYAERIIEVSDLDSRNIINNDVLVTGNGEDWLRDIAPDLVLCAFYQHLLESNILSIPKVGCINMHPSYLPVNRGWHPNEYPILNGSKAGVAIHWIDEDIDTGAIIARREVEVNPTDTGKSLHQRLVNELISLFTIEWEIIKNDPEGTPQEQLPEDASWHSIEEIETYNEIDLNKEYTARELIDILRARTYPPYPGPYFTDEDGNKTYMWIKLFSEMEMEQLENEDPDWT